MMKCHICKSESTKELPTGDYEHVKCPDCGEYKIAGTVVEMAKSRNIDVPSTRVVLRRMRAAGDKIPIITSKEVKFQ